MKFPGSLAASVVAVGERPELPAEAAKRVRRHRARLDGRGVRIERDERSFETAVEDVDGETSGVLIVDALPQQERKLRQCMEDLRLRLGPGRAVRVVQRSRPLLASRSRRVVDRLTGGTPDRNHLCDVPAAIRSSGFTIGSIERFDVERDDGPSELWIDVIALDLGAGGSGEG